MCSVLIVLTQKGDCTHIFSRKFDLIRQPCSAMSEIAVPNSPSHRFAAFQGKSWPIADLPGLKPEETTQLAAIGLHTTQELLGQSQSVAQQTAIAQKLHLHLHHVQKWRALADLARLPSVGQVYCGLLLHAGVPSVRHLATLAPGRLHRQILKLQIVATGQVAHCPEAGLVQQWIQQAKQF
jgi:Domain of unknown function (DUF4332)